MALVALAVSFAVLTLFILPAILQGSNPLVVAVDRGQRHHADRALHCATG